MTETEQPTPLVSVAFPVYDEEDGLDALYAQVRAALTSAGVDYEMVFVDNGSTDRSLEVIRRLHDMDPKVRWVSLSRNFGHQGGLFAGLAHARGDAVITMDADLQHPPSLIPEMVARWREGYEVVYTTKRAVRVSPLKKAFAVAFYALMSRISGLRFDFGQSDFRLLDRRALEAVLSMPEYHKFLRGQVSWIGFKQTGLPYDVADRARGRSKFSYGDLFSLAFDGVFGFSRQPLQVIAVTGLGLSVAAMLYLVYVVVLWLLQRSGVLPGTALPPGWASILAVALLLGSAQLTAIGVVGEYVGRVFDQTKGRPVYIVRETSE